MILGLPDRDVLRAVVNLRANGNFGIIVAWLRKALDGSGEQISSFDDNFSLTKGAGAVKLLAELVRILAEAEELIGLQPGKEEESNEE